jgi:predicted kinase
MHAIITVGVSASGKSTFANQKYNFLFLNNIRPAFGIAGKSVSVGSRKFDSRFELRFTSP